MALGSETGAGPAQASIRTAACRRDSDFKKLNPKAGGRHSEFLNKGRNRESSFLFTFIQALYNFFNGLTVIYVE